MPGYLKNSFYFLAFNLLFLLAFHLRTGSEKYDFLIWNLFLGFLPLAFALIVDRLQNHLPWLLSYFLAFLWFLFYPNSPYMITDLIHIDENVPIHPDTGDVKGVLWDSILIFSFAMQSLFFGFYSLRIMAKLVFLRYGSRASSLLILLTLGLSSFGIYLGRILRLNSWDALTQPLQTAVHIFEHLIPPDQNPETYITIIVFSFVQYLLLQSCHDLETRRSS